MELEISLSEVFTSLEFHWTLTSKPGRGLTIDWHKNTFYCSWALSVMNLSSLLRSNEVLLHETWTSELCEASTWWSAFQSSHEDNKSHKTILNCGKFDQTKTLRVLSDRLNIVKYFSDLSAGASLGTRFKINHTINNVLRVRAEARIHEAVNKRHCYEY